MAASIAQRQRGVDALMVPLKSERIDSNPDHAVGTPERSVTCRCRRGGSLRGHPHYVGYRGRGRIGRCDHRIVRPGR